MIGWAAREVGGRVHPRCPGIAHLRADRGSVDGPSVHRCLQPARVRGTEGSIEARGRDGRCSRINPVGRSGDALMTSTGPPPAPPPSPPPSVPPPGAVPPPVPPPSGGRGDHRGSWIAPLAIAVVGLLLVGVAVVSAGGFGNGGQSSTGEIFLESAASLGQSPFTEPADPEPTTTTTAAVPSAVPVSRPTSGVVPAGGSPPYGGSGDNSVCDREKIVAFLTVNAPQAQAWAGVLGVAVDQIPAYVRGLTPTVLLYDTRVTNHGFANGRATSFQSVLQAGTAVLVDGRGNPVVRCRCGNPLTPPTAVSRPVLTGAPWPGFNPATVVAVNNGATVTVVINVVATTPTTAVPGSSTTASTSSSTGGTTDNSRIEGLLAVVAECSAGAPVEVVDVQDDPVLPNTVTAQLVVNGVPMLFTYDYVNGTVGEGDRASAEFLQTCGVS